MVILTRDEQEINPSSDCSRRILKVECPRGRLGDLRDGAAEAIRHCWTATAREQACCFVELVTGALVDWKPRRP
jgi:hypothetical protein